LAGTEKHGTSNEKALELAQRGQAVDLSGGDAPRAWYALTGPLQNARREIGGASYWQDQLASTTKLHEDGSTTATAVASVYAILGDNEQAIAWLEKAYQQSDDFLVFLNIQPQFDICTEIRASKLLRTRSYIPR